MNKFSLLMLVILIAFYGCAKDQPESSENLRQETASQEAQVNLLPVSLDSFYPPNVEQPLYLFKMIGMAESMTGIMADILEKDFQNIIAGFDKFKSQYVELAKIVPEWKEDFPLIQVEELGTALRGQDQEKVKAAFERVVEVCQHCHLEHMPEVQQKYHWKDFAAILVKDPLTDEEIDFLQLMQHLDVNFSGISVDIEQGQVENAKKQLEGFRAWFQVMKKTCEKCHDVKIKYFVDESVEAWINELDQALSASPFDPETVEVLSKRIGMESCHDCHLVHIPAALAKKRLKQKEGK